MKKQLQILAATMLTTAAAAFAQDPQPMFKIGKAVTPPDENEEIVFEIPDGELSLYSRNCETFEYSYWEGTVTKTVNKGSVVRQTYIEEDGTIWLSNPLTDFTLLSYVKAHFDKEGSIVIEGPQFIYDEYDDWNDEIVNFYLVPMVSIEDELGKTYVPAEDMKYVLKKTENGYEAEDPEMMLGLARYGELVDNEGNLTGELGYAWSGFGDRAITLELRAESNGVYPPEGTAIEEWVFSDPYETALINVALDGNDIYIKGIDRGVKDGWVKGQISDGKITIPSGSYIGINEEIAYFSYLWGSALEYDEENEELRGSATDKVVFSYDADNKKMNLEDGYAICSMPEDYFLLTLYEKVSIYKQNRNINTPPVAPENLKMDYSEAWEQGCLYFDVMPYDEDGNVLNTDNLYYRVIINNEVFTFTPEEYPWLELTESMVNVPYALYDNDMIFIAGTFHQVYFPFEIPESAYGVQAVYINEEGKELLSKIATNGTVGVNMNNADKRVISRSFFNMQGQSVSETYSGPAVCKTVYDDGSVKVTKSLKTRR